MIWGFFLKGQTSFYKTALNIYISEIILIKLITDYISKGPALNYKTKQFGSVWGSF